MQFQVLHLVLPRTMRFVAVHSTIIVVLLFGLGMGACSRTGWLADDVYDRWRVVFF